MQKGKCMAGQGGFIFVVPKRELDTSISPQERTIAGDMPKSTS